MCNLGQYLKNIEKTRKKKTPKNTEIVTFSQMTPISAVVLPNSINLEHLFWPPAEHGFAISETPKRPKMIDFV